MTFSLKLTAMCFATALPLAAFTADVPPAPPHHDWHTAKPKTRDAVIAKTKDMFVKFDLNHDGFITTDEIKAVREARTAEMRKHRFEALDTNHDGVISRDEFMAAHPEGHFARREGDKAAPQGAADKGEHRWAMHRHMMMAHHAGLKRMFTEADTNHDGKLSLDEVLAFRLARFDAIDTNHDGVLSPDEMKAAHAAQRAKWTHHDGQ